MKLPDIRSWKAHTWMGWAGSLIAPLNYVLFAAGLISEWPFFIVGFWVAILLMVALYKDRAQYGAALQGFFAIANIVGLIRIML